MAKRVKGKGSAELAYLRDWLLAVTGFIGGAGFPGALEMEERIIQAAYDRGDLRGMRTIARDKREMLRLASPKERERIGEFLRLNFDRGLDDLDRDDTKEIARVLKRGRIKNDEEGRLLLARVDEIYADESKRDELERINCLLAADEGGSVSN